MEKNSYKQKVKETGSTRLKHILTILEICQVPKRFSEVEAATGWYRDRLVRMLKMLVLLGLIEAKIIPSAKRRKRPIKNYETTPAGLQVLAKNREKTGFFEG